MVGAAVVTTGVGADVVVVVGADVVAVGAAVVTTGVVVVVVDVAVGGAESVSFTPVDGAWY